MILANYDSSRIPLISLNKYFEIHPFRISKMKLNSEVASDSSKAVANYIGTLNQENNDPSIQNNLFEPFELLEIPHNQMPLYPAPLPPNFNAAAYVAETTTRINTAKLAAKAKGIAKPVSSKPTLKQQPQILREAIKMTPGRAPDDLRKAVLSGFLAYKDDLKRLGGRTSEKQIVKRKIIDNFLNNRVFSGVDMSVVDEKFIAAIYDLEHTNFVRYMERAMKSGSGATKKTALFDLGFELWKGDPKAIEPVRIKLGRPVEEITRDMVTPKFEPIKPIQDDDLKQLHNKATKKKSDDANSLSLKNETMMTIRDTNKRFNSYMDTSEEYMKLKIQLMLKQLNGEQ
eukprot:NODE_252_length_11723_cov_1.965933.p2 type:complete len:343 gc:universal NODE_252_length_11723_cov_1.965933:8641-9669(+)